MYFLQALLSTTFTLTRDGDYKIYRVKQKNIHKVKSKSRCSYNRHSESLLLIYFSPLLIPTTTTKSIIFRQVPGKPTTNTCTPTSNKPLAQEKIVQGEIT